MRSIRALRPAIQHVCATAAVFLALGDLMLPKTAAACSRGAVPSAPSFMLPRAETVAPLNTSIWIISSLVILPGQGIEVFNCAQLDVTADEQPIGVQITRLAIAGEQASELLHVTFDEALVPGARVTATCRFGPDWVGPTTSFSIGDAALTAPPPSPALGKLLIEEAYFGACSCGNIATVTAPLDNPDANTFVVAVSADMPLPTTLTADVALLGATDNQELVITDVAGGAASISFVRIGVAGNVSAAKTVSYVMPDGGSGCTSGESSGFALLLLCAAWLALRKRWRAAGHQSGRINCRPRFCQ